MKIEVNEEEMDAIVVEKLKEYRTYFEKWDGESGIPFEEFDKKLENKYRKKMRKSIDMVLGFCGG